jgi:hypothetical protein
MSFAVAAAIGCAVVVPLLAGAVGLESPVGDCSSVGASSPVGGCSGNVPGPPSAPTITKAIAGDGQVKVVWTPPLWDGGSKVTRYVASSTPGKKTCSAAGTKTSCIVQGLKNGKAYTFTVRAQNRHGLGPASVASSSATPATPPSAPLKVKVVAGSGQVTVSWMAPHSTGGDPVTLYSVLSSPGKLGCDTSILSCTVTGLSSTHRYDFTVRATNAQGTGPASAPSKRIAPLP